MNDDYARYRAMKLESGLCYQDFIVNLVWDHLGLAVMCYSSRAYQSHRGESRTGVEIKHDESFAQTRRLWIEIAEKARPRPGLYAASGIQRADNTWLYIIGDYNTIFIFAKKTLRALHATGRYPPQQNRLQTSLGFLLPEHIANRFALHVFTPNAERALPAGIRDLHALGRALHRIARGETPDPWLFPELAEGDGL